jgi:zinc/manganese transport system ATP-binding protein
MTSASAARSISGPRCQKWLSTLYGTEIDVVRADGHIFVMSKGRDVEHVVHLHEEDHAHHQQHHHHHGHASI